MFRFQRRSFKTELFSTLQQIGPHFFNNFKLRPSWLNYGDFEKLAGNSNLRIVPRTHESIEGLPPFLNFLGASEAKLEDLWSGLSKTDLTVLGAVEFTSKIICLWSARQIDLKKIDRSWCLWPISGKMLSLEDAVNSGSALDQDFVDLIIEKTGSISSLSRMLEELLDSEVVTTLLKLSSKEIQSVATGIPVSPLPSREGDPHSRDNSILAQKHISIQRWRSAEQQVLALLLAKDWSLEDVSRQNIGYDLEGRNNLGEIVCIEVKSIQYPGQPFTLTSNEEAVARVKGKDYLLAIVRQSNTFLEVSLISDPANSLEFVRQCRQWVWECSNYSFEPELFPLM